MIEIPRAALTADEIAKEAEFFSFGTNDLTQMTFGFSRDDAGKFLGAYYDKKIYENDPFAKPRPGRRRQAGEDGRQARPPDPPRPAPAASAASTAAIPSSVEFCHKVGLDYVSCSPVPRAHRPPRRRPGCDSRSALSRVSALHKAKINQQTATSPKRRCGRYFLLRKRQKGWLSC